MQPYVIKQGDYLSLLAHKLGFDADAVWNDPANAELRQLRPNPNILWPTDILYIPAQIDKPPVTHTLVTGQMNSFVAGDAPTVNIDLTFGDAKLASQAFTIAELPDLTNLTTDADGATSFAVPVTQQVVTIVFSSDGSTFKCQIGNVDPINTLSGVIQRLQNLGFLAADDIDASNLNVVRSALYLFKLSVAPGPSSSPSADSAYGSSADSADASPASAPPSEPPSSTPPSSAPGDDDSPPDESGLSDDGTLDDATSKLLLSAHGS
jgi:hypothetical protein